MVIKDVQIWKRVLIFLLLFPHNIFAQNEDFSIPFVIVHKSIILRYEFNHSVLNLLLDTGGKNMLDSALARKLGIKFSDKGYYAPTPGASIKVYSLESQFVLGNFGKPFWITNFNLWQHDPLYPLDGIIGGEILNDHKIEIDFKRKQIRLFHSDVFNASKYKEINLVPSDQGAELSKFSRMTKMPSIQGEVILNRKESYPTNFLLDTGDGHEISLIVSDSSTLKKISKGEIKYTGYLKNRMGMAYCKHKVMINGLDHKISGRKLIAYMPPAFQGYSRFGTRKIGGTLGMSFFIKFKSIIIDWPNRKLYLKK